MLFLVLLTLAFSIYLLINISFNSLLDFLFIILLYEFFKFIFFCKFFGFVYKFEEKEEKRIKDLLFILLVNLFA